MTEYQRVTQAAETIRKRLIDAGSPIPTVALVLGSGLQGLAGELTEVVRLPYETIPGFPVPTVSSHAGVLLVGRLAGRVVAVLSGRLHYYEGYDMGEVTLYVKVLHCLGVRTLLLTNAAGGVNESFREGDLMLITDHIKFCADSPARGEQDPRLMPRFFDMSRTYSPRLQTAARCRAEELGLTLREGVYFYMTGPQFETPAEIRAIRLLGGDAVGMSTAPEAIVAAGCGMEVMGLSCITNMAAGVIPEATLSDDEVRVTASRVASAFTRLVCAVVPDL